MGRYVYEHFEPDLPDMRSVAPPPPVVADAYLELLYILAEIVDRWEWLDSARSKYDDFVYDRASFEKDVGRLARLVREHFIPFLNSHGDRRLSKWLARLSEGLDPDRPTWTRSGEKPLWKLNSAETWLSESLHKSVRRILGAREAMLATSALDDGRHSAPVAQVRGQGRFVLHEESCEIEFAGSIIRPRRVLGFEYIHTLLQTPSQPVPVEVLTGGVRRGDQPDLALDSHALREARKRCHRLAREAREAREVDDTDLERACLADLEELEERLRVDTNRLGKGRTLDPETNRIRSRVGHAIKSAIQKLRYDMPELARHLEGSIRDPSGRRPCYDPVPVVDWVLHQEE